MTLDRALRVQIESLVESNDVLLFMKGNRNAPQCGFSAKVTQILNALIPNYQTFDVLSDPQIREGIKEFSSWPTIPQLYVKGEFVGGCDIVQELFESGELHSTLGISFENVSPPSITITDAAAVALKQTIEQAGPESGELHVSVDAIFATKLAVSPRTSHDIESESNGISVLFDALSAQRAEGLVIDFVDTAQASGFKIDNPNAPTIVDIEVTKLKQWLDENAPIELLDVRTPEERAKASIPGSTLLTDLETQRLESLPRDTVLVFHCHRGGRSRAVAEHFAAMGFTRVQNVVGGIDAWALEIDSNVARY